MKNNVKRVLALICAAIMLFAMSATAFAANSSPSIADTNGAVVNSYSDVYTDVSVAAGSGTIAKITDSTMQAKIVSRAADVKTYINSLTATYGTEEDVIWPVYYIAFDLQGLDSGQATINIANDEYKAEEISGYLAVVSHYNLTKGAWEYMDSLAAIDSKGCVTIKFDSYSPILITVTDAKADMLTAATKAKVSTSTTTYTPTQTTVEEAAAAKAATKAPKTGENPYVMIFAFLLVASASGMIVLRRKYGKKMI